MVKFVIAQSILKDVVDEMKISIHLVIHPWMASYMEENLGKNK